MPITVNEGGTLYELSEIYANESGTLYEFDTVHSNEGGTLYEIHSGKKYPKELTWVYKNTSSITPSTSNNGFSVSNDNRPSNDSKYSIIQSNNFEIKDTVTVKISFSRTSSYQGNSGGVTIYDSSGSTIYNSSSTNTSFTDTITLTKGVYYIGSGASGGDSSGTYSNALYLDLLFS